MHLLHYLALSLLHLNYNKLLSAILALPLSLEADTVLIDLYIVNYSFCEHTKLDEKFAFKRTLLKDIVLHLFV